LGIGDKESYNDIGDVITVVSTGNTSGDRAHDTLLYEELVEIYNNENRKQKTYSEEVERKTVRKLTE